jgi:hypothetical protein
MVQRPSFVAATAAWFAVVGVSLFAALGPTPAAREDATPVTPASLILAKSSDHDRVGQNVIYGNDGPLPFPNPFMGTQHDNIFTGRFPVAASGPATGGLVSVTTTSPVTTDGDSVLLPTVN